ncbi:hypothetical protein FRC14_003790 [Serendipita sp. 396]|nr:hypothetical protein FRC14_003790 [Serendipita sp. 396]KAG8802741.1 hypothetical protein FRC16_008764 [Serendipita sp. 398]KAG8868726.1 hypothetical protein FRC20_002941 [Serendipita sp. 405]
MLVTSRKLTFFDLPLEIVENILCEVDPLDIVRCREICRRLCNIIDASIEIQLRIELAIDGELLIERGDLPASKLRDSLCIKRQMRDELCVHQTQEIQCDNTASTPYEVNSGFFGHGIHPTDTDLFRGVSYTQIASILYQGTWQDREWPDLGMDIADLSFDSAQDLQILIEPRDNDSVKRVHFRTFNTNEVHPKANLPYIDLHKEDFTTWDHCFSLLHGCYLALGMYEFFDAGGHTASHIVIRWDSGEYVMNQITASDIAFLDSSSVVLLFDRTGILSVGVFDLELGTQTGAYRLPSLGSPLSVFFIKNPASIPTGSRSSGGHKTEADPRLSIIGIILRYLDSNLDIYVVLRKHKFVVKHHLLKNLYSEAIEFNWAEWGGGISRWFTTRNIADVSLRGIFGPRMLVRGNLDQGDQETENAPRLMLLDFNPRRIKEGKERKIHPEFTTVIVPDDLDLVSDGNSPYSATHIGFQLPFRAILRISPSFEEYADIYLQEDVLIGRMDNLYHIFPLLPSNMADLLSSSIAETTGQTHSI